MRTKLTLFLVAEETENKKIRIENKYTFKNYKHQIAAFSSSKWRKTGTFGFKYSNSPIRCHFLQPENFLGDPNKTFTQ